MLNKYISPFTRCLPIDFQLKHNKNAEKRNLNSCMSSCPLTLEINKMFGTSTHSHVKAKTEDIVHSEAQGQEYWKGILANRCYKTTVLHLVCCFHVQLNYISVKQCPNAAQECVWLLQTDAEPNTRLCISVWMYCTAGRTIAAAMKKHVFFLLGYLKALFIG